MIERILLLAPHPDDGELSSGASLRRWSDEGKEIWYAAFSPCNKSLPDGYAPYQLYDELQSAVSRLGIDKAHTITFDFPVRDFPQYRQAILEEMVKIKKEINPGLVLLPNSRDLHQDHHTIYEEGLRAFKHARLIGYELPWNSLSFDSDFHVKVKASHLEAKIKALQEYKSQQHRPYMKEEFIRSLAQVRGIQVNAAFAEAFELIRWFV